MPIMCNGSKIDIIAIPGFSEPFSSASHLLAAGAAFAGLFYLCYKGRGNGVRLFALLVFSFTLIFLFSMSGVYHLLDPEYLPKKVFQRLDHAAILTLIAGTFTPIHIILFRDAWRWGVLFAVWAIAITGLVLEAVFFNVIPEWMSLGFYLALGWIGVLTSWHFKHQFGDKSIQLLWLGGLFYSLGALLELMRWPVVIPGIVGPHEILHVFVMLGALYHWRFVYKWAHYPTTGAYMRIKLS
ncbi:MAG: DNA-binding protein [Gammaproteobacteria bacterium]|nr:DNA-binding protein [Gammaproteobacteria bacterium]